MTIWTKDFWLALFERVVATFVQVLLAVIAVDGFDFVQADWREILATAGIAAGVAFLKGLLANLATRTGPGLTDSEQVVPPLPQPENPPDWNPRG